MIFSLDSPFFSFVPLIAFLVAIDCALGEYVLHSCAKDQAGSKQNHQTSDHILTLRAIIEDTKTAKHGLLLFVDFCKVLTWN